MRSALDSELHAQHIRERLEHAAASIVRKETNYRASVHCGNMELLRSPIGEIRKWLKERI
jgi:hypothetical protein